jgi:hypothetical protein
LPDLEDADTAITEQERWGLGLIGTALKRLAAAVRLIRTRVTVHEQRLNAIEARLDQLDPPTPPTAPAPTEPPPPE